MIEIDLTEVQRLAGIGLSNEEIAYSLGISKRTLYNRQADNADFAHAIKKGRVAAHIEVANALYEKAIGKDLRAIIWYEKTRRGLSERHNLSIDVRELSDEELQQVINS